MIDSIAYEGVIFIDKEDLTALHYKDINLMHFIWKRSTKAEAYRTPFFG